MLPNAVELVKLIKKASIEAVESTKPVAVYFGTVTSISPLQINAEQKMKLGKSQLILSRNVTDYKTKITVDWLSEHSLEDTLTHKHSIVGKKEITVHNSLVVGDKVILVRQQEGQKFVVLDRIGG